MNFKEIIKNDVKATFLNDSEFAESHILNGKQVIVIIDDDILDGEISIKYNGSSNKAEGLYNGGIRLYISTDDFGKPKKGTYLELDGRQYRVEAVATEGGMYKITMNKVGGR